MFAAGTEYAFLGEFRAPMPIRSRGAFHIVACKRDDDERPVTVVLAPRPRDKKLAIEALTKLARAHDRIDHPLVPKTLSRGLSATEVPWVAFDFPADADGFEIVRLLADTHVRLPYAIGDTLGTLVREALQASHAALIDLPDVSRCLGVFANGNLLFARDGRLGILGFGHNVAALDESGHVQAVEPVFSASEVAMGGAATPMGDYVALLLWLRSYLTHLDIAPMIGRVMEAAVMSETDPLTRDLRYFETQVIHNFPALRPPMEEAIAVSERIRAQLGSSIEPEALSSAIRRLLEGDAQAQAGPAGDEDGEAMSKRAPQALTIAADGSWVECSAGGPRQPLARAQRRVTLALANAWRTTPGRSLDVAELIEAGWPGERPIYEAARNRVYVLVSRLRKLGFSGVLENYDEGYRFRPSVRIATREV